MLQKKASNTLRNLVGAKPLQAMAAVVAASAISATPAYAGEGETEVFFLFNSGSGTIEFLPSPEGGVVFESDFQETAPSNETINPGFDNRENVPPEALMPAGAFLGVNILESLFFWDGSAPADPGAAFITVLGGEDGDAGPVDAVVDGSSGVFTPDYSTLQLVLDQADADGDAHDHFDYIISNGETGAYGLVMSLTTDAAGFEDSIPFGILINNGLSDADFEAGVEFFNAQVVPLPAGVWLLLSGFGLLAAKTRRAKV